MSSESVAVRFAIVPPAAPFRVGPKAPLSHGYHWHTVRPQAVLIFVHGLQSHSGWFGEAAALLHKRGFEVFALDRRGSGISPGRRGDIKHYRTWFGEVSKLVNHVREEHPGIPIHLIGHCFGANISTGYALARPGRVKSIVMLTPGFFVRPDYSILEKAGIALNGFLSPTKPVHVPQDDDLFTRDPDVLEWINEDRLGAKNMTARGLLQANGMIRWLRRNAGRLDVPVLILEATRDRLSDNERNRAFIDEALGSRASWQSFDAEHFLLSEPVRDDVLDAIVDWTAWFTPEDGAARES